MLNLPCVFDKNICKVLLLMYTVYLQWSLLRYLNMEQFGLSIIYSHTHLSRLIYRYSVFKLVFASLSSMVHTRSICVTKAYILK